jgi:hypothetical protein
MINELGAVTVGHPPPCGEQSLTVGQEKRLRGGSPVVARVLRA